MSSTIATVDSSDCSPIADGYDINSSAPRTSSQKRASYASIVTRRQEGPYTAATATDSHSTNFVKTTFSEAVVSTTSSADTTTETSGDAQYSGYNDGAAEQNGATENGAAQEESTSAAGTR